MDCPDVSGAGAISETVKEKGRMREAEKSKRRMITEGLLLFLLLLFVRIVMKETPRSWKRSLKGRENERGCVNGNGCREKEQDQVRVM
jgi:hypothetical protein